MDEKFFLSLLPPEEQLDVFKRFALVLRSSELEKVMERVAEGDDLITAHDAFGLLDRYRADLRKILFFSSQR